MFQLFKKQNPVEQLGLIIDIADDEVLSAVFLSNEPAAFPTLLWQHQEPITKLNDQADLETKTKNAIIKTFESFKLNGLPALRQKGISQLPDLIQVSIKAPLSYTISKNVMFKSDKAFRVTPKLITELESKAKAQIDSRAHSNLFDKDLKLKVVSSSISGITLNGYPTRYPFKSNANEVVLCQSVALASATLVDEIYSECEKHLPTARVDIDSFMSIYSRALAVVSPTTEEAALINVSSDYIEMLNIRESLPQSSFFRKIKLLTPTTAGISGISTVIAKELEETLKESGEGLSVPKNIYVHTKGKDTEDLKNCLLASAKAATGINHKVFLVDNQFFKAEGKIPPALAVIAFVFHKDLYEDHFLEEYRNVLK